MRYIWLALLLILTPSALADSLDFQGSGTLANHTAFTMGAIQAGKTWEVGDRLVQIDDLTKHTVKTGNLGIIDLTTGTLFSCSSGLCFKGGSLDIDNLKNGDWFLGKLASGTISTAMGTSILSATLTNGATTLIKLNGGRFSTQALVHSGVVPEPATLTLLGTGLLSLGLLRVKQR